MKIFYIGKFTKDYATENYVTHALKSCGVKVVQRQYTSTATAPLLEGQVLKHKPDVVLFSKVSSPCFAQFIKWCRSNNYLTVTWLWDLYWGYRPLKPPQFHTDLLFTTDGGHLKNWEELGANHITLRQGIHEPEHVAYPVDTSLPMMNLAFVGTKTSYKARESLVKWLYRTYKNRIVWHTSLRGLNLNKSLAKVKIVVGDSYPAPNYWSNRVYEILGRGGFLLFPETEGLDEEFTDGVHYVSYPRSNYRRLGRLIIHYLRHDEEREKIRRAGFEKCGEYTYTSRVKELLEYIKAYRQGQTVEALAEPLNGPLTSTSA